MYIVSRQVVLLRVRDCVFGAAERFCWVYEFFRQAANAIVIQRIVGEA